MNYGLQILAERERDTWSTDDRNTLTEKQAAIFRYLYDNTKRYGYQPSIREIMREFGFASPQGVVGHLAGIVRKGYCEPATGESRAIRFLRRPDGTPFDGFKD